MAAFYRCRGRRVGAEPVEVPLPQAMAQVQRVLSLLGDAGALESSPLTSTPERQRELFEYLTTQAAISIENTHNFAGGAATHGAMALKFFDQQVEQKKA